MADLSPESFFRFRRIVQAGLVSLCLAATLVSSSRADDGALEVRVKAAYLYKFAGYVEWPPGVPEQPIVFGVIGDDELAGALSRIVDERAAGARPVRVLRLRAFDPLPPLHVLFIGRSESDRLGPLVRSARGAPILVVTDTEGALGLGSMINLRPVGSHLGFEVGLGAAQRSHLGLSASLLAVAQVVTRRTP